MLASRPRPNQRLLIVEFDGSMGTFATRVLRRAGFDTTHVPTGEDAVVAMTEGSWDGLLIDTQLPGMSGVDLIVAARDTHPRLPIVVVTGYLSAELAGELDRCGADAVLVKPLTPAGLTAKMRELLEDRRSRRAVGPS